MQSSSPVPVEQSHRASARWHSKVHRQYGAQLSCVGIKWHGVLAILSSFPAPSGTGRSSDAVKNPPSTTWEIYRARIFEAIFAGRRRGAIVPRRGGGFRGRSRRGQGDL